MERSTELILAVAIGSRVTVVTNPVSSMLDIHYTHERENHYVEEITRQFIGIEYCNWEIKQSGTLVCHSETSDISAGVQVLMGKRILGFSWYCEIENPDSAETAALWGVIRFSERLNLIFSPYAPSPGGETQEACASYLPLLSVHCAGSEVVFLRTGEVKRIAEKISTGM